MQPVTWSKLVSTATLVALTSMSVPWARAQAPNPAEPAAATRAAQSWPTNQIIIRFKASARATRAAIGTPAQMRWLSEAAQVELTYFRPMVGDAHVLQLPTYLPEADVEVLAARLEKLPEVDYAEPDYIFQVAEAPSPNAPTLTPNDTRYGEQWHYLPPPTAGGVYYGVNAPAAWNITTGSNGVYVAVLDTGHLYNHPDLADRAVAGYDMISDSFMGNDGGGRDSDASDPGDWVAADACGYVHEARDSSWHGTHVAGTIGAASNNNLGVAGLNWVSKIVPVRVLGRCGGTTSDIADGMLWAAGLPVAGVPNNPTPARVLNLSLGGTGTCPTTYQTAIDAAVLAGAVVVVAAGNSNQDASLHRPANCNNVITVAATNRDGNRAPYSNYGSVVEIAAPGGDVSAGGGGTIGGVLSTLSSSTTSPDAGTYNYEFYPGTSMATPHVAGVISLMLSVNPSLSPAQVLSTLQNTVTPFPGGSTCSTSICGPGILNAAAAVAAVAPAQPKLVLTLIIRVGAISTGIPNGNFESGSNTWTIGGFGLIANSNFPVGITPHGGSWMSWLAGYDSATDYIQQDVLVPPGNSYLGYWHLVNSSETLTGWDFGKVFVNGIEVDSYDLATDIGWTKRVIDLSSYAGNTVTLRFRATTDSSAPSSWFIDDVAWQSTP